MVSIPTNVNGGPVSRRSIVKSNIFVQPKLPFLFLACDLTSVSCDNYLKTLRIYEF